MNEEKKKLIEELLSEIKLKKKLYYKIMKKFKKYDDISEAILMGSSAIAVSSIFTTIVTINPITLIISATFASINSVGSAVKRVVNIREKHESYKTTYNQLSDLFRESRVILARNHLDSDDLDNLLNDISNRLSLIEDSSLPIKIESKSK